MKKDNNYIKDFFSSEIEEAFKKLKLNSERNLFITSNLSQISKIRIPKEKKLNLILGNLRKILKKNHTIFSPSSNLDLFYKQYIFDIENTPSFKMGPLAEHIRSQKGSIRSMHPFWSVTGIGQNAKLLKNVSKHAYGYGSPWSIMLNLDTIQLNLGLHPSKAVTLIHHIETICGVPYRFNKEFECKIKIKNRVKKEKFYLSVFFKNQNIKKRIKLNEHFFDELSKKKKLKYFKTESGLEIWSFKMRDFFEIVIKNFNKNIFDYLESKPDLSFQKKL